MADVTKEQVVDFLSKMTVLDLAGSDQGARGQVGRQGGSGCGGGGGWPGGGRRAAAPAAEQTEFTVILTEAGAQQDRRHQGGPRGHQPRPQRGEGSGRRRAQDGQRRRLQGRRRDDQEEAGRGGRQGRRQVVVRFVHVSAGGLRPKVLARGGLGPSQGPRVSDSSAANSSDHFHRTQRSKVSAAPILGRCRPPTIGRWATTVKRSSNRPLFQGDIVDGVFGHSEQFPGS